MNIVSEDLNIEKTDPLRAKYPELFKEASRLHGQCSILDYKYKVAGSGVVIDWSRVWDGLTVGLPERLGIQLQKAIEAETSKGNEA